MTNAIDKAEQQYRKLEAEIIAERRVERFDYCYGNVWNEEEKRYADSSVKSLVKSIRKMGKTGAKELFMAVIERL